MEFFKIRKDIPFMRHALIFNVISLVTFIAAVFFLFSRGLHLSVEFTGGTVMEVSYSQPADLSKVRGLVSGLGFADVQVQNFGTARDVMIRLPVQKGITSAQQSEKVLSALKADDPKVSLRRTEFVGPQVGDELAADGHHRQSARRDHHPGLLCLLPVGVFAGGAGSGARRAGLLGQRIRGDF